MYKKGITQPLPKQDREYNDYKYMESVLTSTVIKTGTSLAVVIPVQILRALKISKGDKVCFAVYEDKVVTFRVITDLEQRALKPKHITV